MSSRSRILRGRETERLLAADLRNNGAPDAAPVPASIHGRDILGIPGLAIEVKARKGFDLLAWLRQAVSNADGDLPMVVLRCNGQGEKSVDEWPVITRWGDMKTLLKEGNYLNDCNSGQAQL